MRALSPNKDLQQLITKAVRQGWDVEVTKSNHLKWTSPSGERFSSAKTPSDHRAIKYVKQYLKRYGFVEGKK
jgi:hypothetical protein